MNEPTIGSARARTKDPPLSRFRHTETRVKRTRIICNNPLGISPRSYTDIKTADGGTLLGSSSYGLTVGDTHAAHLFGNADLMATGARH